jgi:predicted metal-dependent enzyme (double-stranded beta helix superfamily)
MRDNLPDCIEKLIIDLSNQKQIDNPLVNQVISETEFNEKQLKPYFYFDHPPEVSYGRKLIWKNDNFMILLMSWCPGDFTAIHNHGRTEWGSVHFLGDTTHRLYAFKNDQLEIVESSEFISGQSASVCGDLIHLMGNAGNKNVATLHIYGMNTPLQREPSKARVYVPEQKKVVFTEGSAFLNMCPTLSLGEDRFSDISTETLTDYLQLIIPFYKRNKSNETISFIDKILQNPEYYYQEKEYHEQY